MNYHSRHRARSQRRRFAIPTTTATTARWVWANAESVWPDGNDGTSESAAAAAAAAVRSAGTAGTTAANAATSGR